MIDVRKGRKRGRERERWREREKKKDEERKNKRWVENVNEKERFIRFDDRPSYLNVRGI